MGKTVSSFPGVIHSVLNKASSLIVCLISSKAVVLVYVLLTSLYVCMCKSTFSYMSNKMLVILSYLRLDLKTGFTTKFDRI